MTAHRPRDCVLESCARAAAPPGNTTALASDPCGPALGGGPCRARGLLLGHAHRELLAPFSPTAPKHLAAGRRAHTFPEAMGSLPALSVRLESPLRHVILRLSTVWDR